MFSLTGRQSTGKNRLALLTLLQSTDLGHPIKRGYTKKAQEILHSYLSETYSTKKTYVHN